MKKIVNQNRVAIEKALRDYIAHTNTTGGMFDGGVDDVFVDRLARDSAWAKKDLRELFRKADGWNENLQAIVINGTTTHDPDDTKVYRLASELLDPAPIAQSVTDDLAYLVYAKHYFLRNAENNNVYADALKHFIGNKFRPDKKKSKLFQELAKAVGVYDGKAGSNYQKLFAQLADELNGHKLDFKLFLSINPAHILTASNPIDDQRGQCLVSCHSLNRDDYNYGAGNVGYARDDITFVAFTVDNPDDAETLNNRKTSRQFFFYKPYSGVLLQSRLYDAQGGTWGEQKISKLYRDLVQRTISKAENAFNLWVTRDYYRNEFGIAFDVADGFGGYADWLKMHQTAEIKISVRKACVDTAERYFVVGAPSLCVDCGDEIYGDSWLCDYCDGDHEICAECDDRINTDCGSWAFNADGDEVFVCESCLVDDYFYCEDCGHYHHRDNGNNVADGRTVCNDCFQNYVECKVCGDYIPKCDTITLKLNGGYIDVCRGCYYSHGVNCVECGERCHEDDIDEDGYCSECAAEHNHEGNIA